MLGIFLVFFTIFEVSCAQTFTMNACASDMVTIQDFNKTAFAGRWYEYKHSYNIAEIGIKCLNAKLELSDKYVYHAIHTHVANNETHSKLNIYTADDLSTGKLKFTPGYISHYQCSWTLDTDYENYAVSYSCLDAFDGKLEYAWILARSPKFNQDLLQIAENTLRERGIDMEMFIAIQDCD